MEIKDLAGLSQPLTKLVEVVSSAVGTVYRPKAIRDEADAQAYAKKALARADTESALESKALEFSSALDRVQQALKDHPQLAERARNRLLAREVEGQLNVESIADFASEALPPAVSSQPVNADWRRKFFQEAENVCESDMQLLWGKVLAGEVTAPGTYSTRTLDTLRRLSKWEAELFRKACAIAMSDGWIAVPTGDLNESLKPFGLTYTDILSLRDAGLLMDGDHIHKDFSQSPRAPDGSARPVVLFNNGVMIELSGASMAALRLPALLFTRAGTELQRLNGQAETPEYLAALAAALRQRGLSVKRGTDVPQGEGLSVVVFEQDL
ncbi:DUF2806 domain-containing protein [Roseateles paludis]|uniref:DUF2806 domain-containing protein n=1 Tax=Roseateles paludis TaxID=3145238 RepID=A0ABV0FX91_9BURK